MKEHAHIYVPHCDGRQNCQWLICVVCNGYGEPTADKWAVNPFKFYRGSK